VVPFAVLFLQFPKKIVINAEDAEVNGSRCWVVVFQPTTIDVDSLTIYGVLEFANHANVSANYVLVQVRNCCGLCDYCASD